MEDNSDIQKRLEMLENQLLAQQLLIDELEKIIQELQYRVSSWDSFSPTTGVKILPISVSPCAHVWVKNPFTSLSWCVNCGQSQTTTTMTITCGTQNE